MPLEVCMRQSGGLNATSIDSNSCIRDCRHSMTCNGSGRLGIRTSVARLAVTFVLLRAKFQKLIRITNADWFYLSAQLVQSQMLCGRATVVTKICRFNHSLIFLSAHSKELLHRSQMFLFLIV
jgi:hypothetical protein